MFEPGTIVLVRATVLPDGRLLVAPGAAVDPDVAEIVTDQPRFDGLAPVALLMFFPGERERDQYAAQFVDNADVWCRDVNSFCG